MNLATSTSRAVLAAAIAAALVSAPFGQQVHSVHCSGLNPELSAAPVAQHFRDIHPCGCVPYATVTGSSDGGRLRTSIESGNPLGNVGIHSQVVSTSYALQDVIFTSPPGVTSTTVTLYLTLNDVEQSGTGNLYINSLGLQVGLWNSLSGSITNSNGGVSSTGPISLSWASSSVVAVGPLIVPTNMPITLHVLTNSDVRTVAGFGRLRFSLSLGDGSSDFGGPYQVFELEPGITANSVSGNIIDNQWTPASEVGYRFCEPLAPNSSGLDAWIHATGSNDITANDTTLVVTGLPTAGTTAMLINSRAAWAGVNNPASAGVPSDGRICIGGSTFGRHGANIFMGTAGTFSVPLDLTALPHPDSPSTYSAAVVAGETWYWQCWYRDNTLGPGRSNFSGAIGITFE